MRLCDPASRLLQRPLTTHCGRSVHLTKSNMRVARLLPSLLLFGLVGCSEASSPKVCGESFCFPEGTKLLSQEAPVEDFNLYRVEANGQAFVVYEGNAPQRHQGSFVLPWRKGWPNYLEISGPCASPSNCAAMSFAAEIPVAEVATPNVRFPPIRDIGASGIQALATARQVVGMSSVSSRSHFAFL